MCIFSETQFIKYFSNIFCYFTLKFKNIPVMGWGGLILKRCQNVKKMSNFQKDVKCQKDVKLSKRCQMSKSQTHRLWKRFTKKN